MMKFTSVAAFLASLLLASRSLAGEVKPRHCHGSTKHIHITVGKDPSREMTISFASKWAHPDVQAPIAGVHVGTTPSNLDRFVGEQEFPKTYNSSLPDGDPYYAPYQHHITIDGLEPNTRYYYVPVVGNRNKGIQKLQDMPLKDHASQHPHESDMAENKIVSEQEMNDEEEEATRLLIRRKLAPHPYDGSEKPCIDDRRVRSFTTAPETTTGPVTFAIIGDLGQFEHSQETLEHMRDHSEGINAVVMVGDIAYTDNDHRRWDTFFDFLDDFSIFDELPLQIAAGNHDIEKGWNRNEIFQAYETRFRMPQVHPAQLGTYDGKTKHDGSLQMEKPPYPLPYEWGNAYYSFVYGSAKHIVVNAYSSMEPDSQQYGWFKQELESADRTKTPWVLVTIHVPLYNTFSMHLKDPQIFAAREHLEPLMVQHHVNLVFTGHIHAYQRTANVAMEELDPKGPIHITVGAGGRACNAPFVSEEAEPWLLTRDASYYGYGTFQIHNATHADWKWIPLSPSEKHDYNYMNDEEKHLPSLDHDRVTVENQFYL